MDIEIRKQPEMSPVSQTVKDYVSASVSDNTKKALQHDLKRFLRWGGQIPSTPDQIAEYLSQHADSHRISTIKRWKTSISKAHASAGFKDPAKTEIVRAVIRGIARTHGSAKRQMIPTLKADIITIINQMGDQLVDKRDATIILIGFAAALRRSEICALQVEHVSLVNDGLLITIPHSKTDQEGEGHKIAIPYARGRLCPVKAYQEWISASEIENGPVFRSIDRHGNLSDLAIAKQSIALIIKRRVSDVGMDPENYAGHSLRAGLVTSAAVAGVPFHKIKAQTRHRSDRVLHEYIRDADIFADNAASIM
jgi:integrase